VKAIIFDMYGVILKDPHGALMPFIQSVLPHVTDADVYPLWKQANDNVIAACDFWEQVGFREAEATQKAYLETVQIDEDFFRVASALRRKYRLAVLSNDVAEWSRFVREKYCLNPLFDAVVVSGEAGVSKPDPQIFRLVLDLLGLPAEECLFVDDRRANLRAAQALGMDVVLFNRRQVPYDGKTVNSFEELRRLLA